MTQGTSLRRFELPPIRALTALLAVIIFALLMSATVARAQPFTVLYSFCYAPFCPDGQIPGSLIQATDGNFYGTTQYGGLVECDLSCGTVFKLTPSGTLTTLYRFCTLPNCADGADPGALIQATDGDFYGVTSNGGANGGGGTVFKITSGGELTTLYSFCYLCANGSYPLGELMQARNGDIYGTTSGGGTNGGGTVFKITPSGALTTLYSFCSLPNCADGSFPDAALIQATNGDIYGTTYNGGTVAWWAGTVFKITPSGTLTTLYNFCSDDYPYCSDGYKPGDLIQANNGDFYGVATAGGPTLSNIGTVFKLTAGETLTTLHTFCSEPNCTDGNLPAALIQASNGGLYGTTYEGGSENLGTVFTIAPGGALTTLFNFCGGQTCAEGYSYGPGLLIQATNGDLYGTTSDGGGGCYQGDCFNGGTIFRLKVGLGPFVALQTSSGEVGATVTILGTDLTGATSVTFNGTPATFNVNSTGTAIRTTVPAGATTGTVTVVTPSRSLDSNKPFRVLTRPGSAYLLRDTM